MAVKRAKKKTTNRSRAKRKPTGNSFFKKVLIALLLCIGILAATYHFGSFPIRTQMERAAIHSINAARLPEWMPRPIVNLLNMAYDAIPQSQGLVVEGGELGYGDSPLIAGVPTSKSAVRVLHNKSYINLFNEQIRQTTCVAFKLTDSEHQDAAVPTDFFEDPRINQLKASDIAQGNWLPKALAPPAALAREFGTIGANEACIVTNLIPMAAQLSDGVWPRLLHELTEVYPARFGEIWIYLGPVLSNRSAKLDSGISIPDAFYAIAFDISDMGGLRAIAFLVPQDATDTDLGHYLTSIVQIEELTSLEFLPEVALHAQEVLAEAVSPQLW